MTWRLLAVSALVVLFSGSAAAQTWTAEELSRWLPRYVRPNIPVVLTPAPGATNVPLDLPQIIYEAIGATSCDLYLGVNTTTPPLVATLDKCVPYTVPAGSLQSNSNYSVRIRARNAAGTRDGPITSFTTVAAAPVCTYALSHSSFNYPAAGGQVKLGVTTQTGCSWTGISDQSWLQVTSGFGNGSGELLATVHANTGPARSGRITVEGHQVVVNQDGFVAPPPSPSVTVPATVILPAPLSVSWQNPTPSVTDWIGLFPVGTPDGGTSLYVYTSSCGAAPGSTPQASGSCPMTIPTPGQWEARLFCCDGFGKLATSGVVVASVAPPPEPQESGKSNEVTHTTTDPSETVYLTWEAPAGTITSYRFYQGNTPGVYGAPVAVEGTSTSVFLTPGTYYFAVSAFGFAPTSPLALRIRASVADPPDPQKFPDRVAAETALIRDQLEKELIRDHEANRLIIRWQEGQLCNTQGACVALVDILHHFPSLKQP